MTNKEMLIKALQAFNGEYENSIDDYIACPYYANCENEKNGVDIFNSLAWSEGCSECKKAWLLKEVEE